MDALGSPYPVGKDYRERSILNLKNKAMNLTRKWFIWAVVLAFPAFMLLINTNSYHADKSNLNTAYLIGGIVLALAALYCFYKAFKYGSTPKE